jgi:hypothetical protein
VKNDWNQDAAQSIFWGVMSPRRIATALLFAAALGGCGSAPPPTVPTVAPSATTAPSTAKPPREADPEPISSAQRKDFEQRCKPLVEAIVEEGKKLTGPAAYKMQDALAALSKRPPPALKEADRAFCFDVAERDMRGYLIGTVGASAKVTLGALGRRMQEVYDRDKKLCPSTTKPVPADFDKLASGPVAVTKDDFTGPAWECLLAPPLEKTLVQLELKTDEAAGTFELVARASPLRNGKAVEWVQAGQVKDGKLTLRPIERR